MKWTIITAIASFVLSAVAVAMILYIARKKSWYDKIDERKIHTGNIPRLGGIGFALSFFAVYLFLLIYVKPIPFDFRYIVVFIAMFFILQFGVLDDFKPLQPKIKLLFQCIVAISVVISGFVYRRFLLVDFFGITGLSWFRYPLTFIFIVGITNAMNFIDGVDGLAGGICAIIAITYSVILGLFFDNTIAVLLSISLASVIAGFLIFNLPIPKAKIFMGDGGSQFLGFVLAVLPIINRGNAQLELPLTYAIALLIIPIFDTIAAIWRRVRDGRRIDSPDKLHIHHKLMNLGLNARGIIGVLYTLQIVIGVLVFFSVKIPGKKSLFFLLSAYLIGLGFFTVIHYMNKSVMKNNAAPVSPEEK